MGCGPSNDWIVSIPSFILSQSLRASIEGFCSCWTITELMNQLWCNNGFGVGPGSVWDIVTDCTAYGGSSCVTNLDGLASCSYTGP